MTLQLPRPPTPIQTRSERGVVGGIEVLPFGVLIFVAGALLLANLWAVVDAKLTVEAAAREAGRAYAEAPNATIAEADADVAARDAAVGAGRNPARLKLRNNNPTFARCEVVEYVASYRLPALTIPFLGEVGKGTTVTGRHREVIDPFGAGLQGTGNCG